MSNEALVKQVDEVDIFAEIEPNQKELLCCMIILFVVC
jgi:magnesium-transporting ATPase (P-type)